MNTESPRALDLDVESRRALEFDELLEWIATFTRTPFGARRVRQTTPAADASAVDARLSAVNEARSFIGERGHLISGRLPDPAVAVAGLKVADLRIDPTALRDLAVVLQATNDVRSNLLVAAEKSYPILRNLGRSAPDLSAESAAILRGMDDKGNILDGASRELRRIRAALSRAAERLRNLLQRYLRDPGAQSVIRDDFITQRSGRFVIPVRTDAPRSIRGIVHASSSSGATRFVEPLESVDLNNEMVRLAEEERDEEERILSGWADAFRRRRQDIDAALDVLGRADDLQARSLFAEQTGGVLPRVVPGGRLRLRDVRHPLLDRRLREQGASCVPASLEIDPAAQVVILSGPNTGGKTVVLKTVGLAVLMAQSGIPVTAKDAELPLFRQVRADIGDHQSIHADLSTYSAHITAIVEFLETSASPSLMLFDEIGTGTEPAEGAALAQAILESLLGTGNTAMATTHLGALKAWASTTEGSVCAAMEIDPASLKPTYRILMNAAGVSAGLEIAERLGMKPEIIERARLQLDPETRKSEDYLKRLHRALADAEATRERVRDREIELDTERRRIDERMSREADARREEASRRLDQSLEQFRRAARKEIATLVDASQRDAFERRFRKSERRVRSEQVRLKAAFGPNPGAEAESAWVVPEAPRPGMRVFVTTLGKRGEVVDVEGHEARVMVGRITVRVARSDLRIDPDAGADSSDRTSRVEIVTLASRSAPGELVLIGQRVEEALEQLDRFLDSAQLAGHAEVRVVHGHGTGKLRAAVRKFLGAHSQVSDHRPGRPREGGDGATVVRLV